MKKLIKEFKTFITRGNVLDLAVGVIVGGAFTAIVTALTNNIIRPLVNWIIMLVGGKEGLSSAYTFLSKVYTTDASGASVVDLTNSIYIDWGKFISAIIDFFIIAIAIFAIVKIVNRSREMLEDLNERLEKETKKEVRAEKRAVYQKAKEEGKSFKVAWAEHKAEKQRMADEKARILAEEKAKKEQEEKLKNPTTEMLLAEIRDLLKGQKK